MKLTKLIKSTSVLVGIAAIGVAFNVHAELYRVTSIAPGMSPFVVNTAIAKVVGKHVPGVDMQVRATGAATRHVIEAAQGKVDFFFNSGENQNKFEKVYRESEINLFFLNGYIVFQKIRINQNLSEFIFIYCETLA